jgi:pilus assembly protein TadC
MTQNVSTAARVLLPFVSADLVLLTLHWFFVPEGSWLAWSLSAISFVVLPLSAAVALTRASFKTGAAVLSALIFAALGLVWAACAAALGYAGSDWPAYLGGALISTLLIAAPLQLLAAYIGTRYARYTVEAAN